MRVLASLLVIAALAFPVAARAGAGSCSVVPSTVPYRTDFHVEYSGLTGNIWYWLRIDQGQESTGHHPEEFFLSEPGGSGSFALTNPWDDPREALAIGSARVRLYPAKFGDEFSGKGPSANCQFVIT